jgi:pyridoxine 5-phosphate synthase
MRLCINIDHIATLRQARRELEPDPVVAAGICELAGADGIVCHLREDRRHIIDRDLQILKDTVKTKLDLEMAAVEEIIAIACKLKPDMVTLVPERREEVTTEGGIDIARNKQKISQSISRLQESGMKVSVFIEPLSENVDLALEVGADMIEIHTGKYALLKDDKDRLLELDKVRQTTALAKQLAIGVNAGHGLNYLNIVPLLGINEIDEVSIGHSIIARAVFVGLDNAVKEMLRIIRRVRP